MKEYKILTQKDKMFSGKFDPEQLEKAINSYAENGWKVISITTASIPSFTGSREELIVVFEKDKPCFTENTADELKACPYCGEYIKNAAKKCMYCKQDL